MKFSKYYIFLVIIVALGTYSRFEGIIAGTFGFTHDQGRDLLAAQSILNSKLTLIGPTTGLAGLFHGPLWYYVISFFLLLGRGDPRFVLGGIVFLFLAAELFLFWIIKKYYGSWLAIVSLTLITLSPLISGLNGQLWSPTMIIFSTIVMAASLIAIANKQKYYWLLGLALGANIQFEAAGGTFLLIATITTLLLVNPFKTKIKDYIILIGSFLITVIPQLLFEIRHEFLMTKQAISYLGDKKTDFIAEHGIKSLEYKTGLFYDNFNQLFFRDNIDLGLIFILIIFAIFVRFYITQKQLIKNTKTILITSISLIFFEWLILNFYFDVVWNHFIFGLLIFYLAIVIFALHNIYKYFPFIANLIIAGLVLIMAIPMLKGLNKQQNIIGDHSYYRNHIEIVNEIFNSAGTNNFNVVIYEPTTFSYTYDYLFAWYGKKTYNKIPVSNEQPQKLVYYIIEPDNIVGRKEKWVNERDGDGEIIWEKEYWNTSGAKGNGLILQKRSRSNLN